MRDMAKRVQAWRAQGKEVALAVVVRTWGSSPREVGAVMAVSGCAEMAGSVSGGCVEGSVLLHALNAIKRRQPCLATFGTSDDKAWEVGAPCGGDIEVAVLPYQDELHDPLMAALADGRPATYILSLDGMARAEDLLTAKDVNALYDEAEAPGGVRCDLARAYREGPVAEPGAAHPFRDAQAVIARPDAAATAGDGALGAGAEAEIAAFWAEPFFLAEAQDALARHQARAASGAAGRPEPGGVLDVCGVPVFACAYGTRPRIVCVGAVHIAAALCELAAPLGIDVDVVDPRPVFATPERFPHARRLVRAWPQDALPELGIGPDTAVCVLTHDPKIDVPALVAALATEACYIGCLGHAETLADRRAALLAAGVEEAQLARVFGPIGLWIGGRTPEEIALSALAQIQAVRSGRIAHGADMPGHTLDFYTPGEMASIAAWRAGKVA